MGETVPRQQCPAWKRNGRRCDAVVLPTGYCVGHDPRGREWRRMGGRATSRAARAARALPAFLRPAVEGLAGIMSQLYHVPRQESLERIAFAFLPPEVVREREMQERMKREVALLPTPEKSRAALYARARELRQRSRDDPLGTLRTLAAYAERLVPPLRPEEAVHAWNEAGQHTGA